MEWKRGKLSLQPRELSQDEMVEMIWAISRVQFVQGLSFFRQFAANGFRLACLSVVLLVMGGRARRRERSSSLPFGLVMDGWMA